MTRSRSQLLTLIELLLAVTVTALISAAATALVSACLQAYSTQSSDSQLYAEGVFLMDRITNEARVSSTFLLPNSQAPVRTFIAFSRNLNEDGDYYYGDTLFPKCDEDSAEDLGNDGHSGIFGVDDDGNGFVDDMGIRDDDEDGLNDEDPVDGRDNDEDGSVDEDPGQDRNGDGAPGVSGLDDDNDGNVDETHWKDDDEDIAEDEDWVNPVLYSWNGSDTLSQEIPATATVTPLSTQVTFFQVTHEAPGRIKVEMTLTGGGQTAAFVEYVCPRNTYQKTGKRVR